MKSFDSMVGPFDREMRRFAKDLESLYQRYSSVIERYRPGADQTGFRALKAREQALLTIYGVTLKDYDNWQRASVRATQAARRRLDRWKN